MSPFPLNPALWQALFDEARACYPNEACGIVLGPPDAPDRWRFVPFENQQDRLHARDPERYPRDARTAYAMSPLKLHKAVEAAEAAGEALVAIAHSHPDHPSYFSRTDAAAASPFGTPTWPAAVQLVVSVFDGEVRDIKGFSWDGGGWPERPVEGPPALPGPPPGARPFGDV
jgi:proteasome lid subunit RPN8/RPN11